MPKTKKSESTVKTTKTKETKTTKSKTEQIIPIRYAGIGSIKYIKQKGGNGYFWYLTDEDKVCVLDCTKNSTPVETVYDTREEFRKFIKDKKLTLYV